MTTPNVFKQENKANANEKEAIKVPNYGDIKIDQAKGKRCKLC